MQGYVLRTFHFSGKGRIWCVFTEELTLWGKPNESKTKLISRFENKFKIEITKIITYTGVMRVSEAVMTMADVQQDENTQYVEVPF